MVDMAAEGDIGTRGETQWRAVLEARRGGAPLHFDAGELQPLYGPLCAVAPGECFTVAHLAQSLDGRIATTPGASRWISGEEDLRHTHRMRALADAVIVGAETIRHDDPLLTVRRCAGDSPVRVIIDPQRRLASHYQVFRDRSAQTIVIAAEHAAGESLPNVEIVTLPRDGAAIAPRAIQAALAARGLHWLFIEGGGVTVSHFLEAGCLDRLQLAVAPLLLGSGRPSLTLPAVSAPSNGVHPEIRRFAFGRDTLFECIFRR
jgi:diaminohydroxyphosphoribosylaminopyrimidine deaminase / 5-amino-6-(5-phosphoribosylamino)uracil reductase